MHSSLYVKYGGFLSIHTLIENFYEKVLISNIVGSYFKHSDMEALITHQTNFISSLLGGPVSFTDQQLKCAHGNIKISEEAWDEAINLLKQSLSEFGMEKVDSEMLINTILDKKELVLCTQ